MLDEAETWLGTNFHHRASVKCIRNENGKIVDVGGVDCACFIAESFNRSIGARLTVPEYYDQWHLHRDDEMYLEHLHLQGFIEIPRAEKRPGDLIVARVGRLYSHGAIIFGWPCAQCLLDYPRINRESHGCVIQAESRKAGKVTRVHDVEKNWYFQMNPVKFFRWGPWHV